MPAPSISSSGEAVVYVVPDEVIVGFGIETFHANLDKAKAANDAAAGTLLKAVKAIGVEEKNIQTDTMQVSIRYEDGSHPTHGIEGYYARRTYSVTLKDVKLLEKLIDTALKNGANQIMGIEYRTSELRKHRDTARKMAIKACREKADALAAELDCRAGAPRTISEVGYGYYGGYGQWGANFGNNLAQQNAVQAQPGGGGAEGEETMPLGQMAVRASVSVMFDLVVKR